MNDWRQKEKERKYQRWKRRNNEQERVLAQVEADSKGPSLIRVKNATSRVKFERRQDIIHGISSEEVRDKNLSTGYCLANGNVFGRQSRTCTFGIDCPTGETKRKYGHGHRCNIMQGLRRMTKVRKRITCFLHDQGDNQVGTKS